MRPFTEKQIELVTTFADQAVIAIENVRLFEAEQQRTRELTESLEQQTATSEVLHVISSSPGDLQPVFATLLKNAVRICDASFGNLFQWDGNAFSLKAAHNTPPAFAEARKRTPYASKTVVHIADAAAEPGYIARSNPAIIAAVELAGVRSVLTVPMLKENELVGSFALYRQEVRPFTDKQIELVKNFAAQAIIAIENTRLLNELRQRTTDLQQALARQTATSEILRVISQSPTDVQPVFDSIVLTAARLLRCDLVFVLLCDGATFSPAAVASPEGLLADRGPANLPIDRSANFPSRAILDKKMLHLPDWSLIDLPEHERNIRKIYGVNSALYLPLLRGGECIGLLALVGKRPNSFGPSEIAQAESFRDQALIAIENTRLFNETKEALEQQTATSEVLQVISSSPGDLEPVFATMLENAERICGADFGNIYRWDGDALRLVATHNTAPGYADTRSGSYRPDPNSPVRRMLTTKTVVQVIDSTLDPGYIARIPEYVTAVEIGGVRTVLAVPMLKEDELIGAIVLSRRVVRAFDDKQIALVTSFASQAVIAIENARLLTELRQRTTDLTESLEQQTATSEVLKVISSSPGELEPVFTAMLENAVRICDAKFGMLWLAEGNGFRSVALQDVPPAFADERQHERVFRFDREIPMGRLVETKRIVHVADITTEPGYIKGNRVIRELAELGGARTLLLVPMLKENALVGVIAIYRQEVRPFTDKQIELVQNFAAQAVIAIENTRLLTELRQRTTDLTESLEQQTATSEVLQVISSSPGDLEPVFATMLENAVRICDAKFGNIQRWDGEVLHLVATHKTPPAFAEARRRVMNRPSPTSPSGRMVATKTAVHVADLATDQAYVEQRAPSIVAAVELGGVRTILYVPMLKENELVGAFTLSRQEVRPFTDKQIALVTNFAAQAVIAIENARLLSELRESLAQQTATADVLSVISSSPGDLKPVFDAMLANAARLCEAQFGNLLLCEGDAFRVGAMHNMSPDFAERFRREPVFHASPLAPVSRATASKEFVHIVDLTEDAAYKQRDPPVAAVVDEGGARSMLVVPMLKEGKAIGALSIFRQAVRPFTDKQIELVQNFAAQAVIAIENTRLLTELRQRTDDLTESLEQQTATADVLRVISSSPGDLQPVFELDIAERDPHLWRQLWQSRAERKRLIPHRGDVQRAKGLRRAAAARSPHTPSPAVGACSRRRDQAILSGRESGVAPGV